MSDFDDVIKRIVSASEGWTIRSGRGDGGFYAVAHYHVCGVGEPAPDYSYSVFDADKEAAIRQVRDICLADKEWPKMADDD